MKVSIVLFRVSVSKLICAAAMLCFAKVALADAAMITGCPEFEVALPKSAVSVPVVRAVDFGLSFATSNDAAAINLAIAEAKRIGASGVELAPGTYFCHDARGIVLDGLTDFTFDGKGAKLVFCRPSDIAEGQEAADPFGANMAVRNCRRVLVEGFTMDWDWSADPIAVWVKPVDKKLSDEDDGSFVDFELVELDRHPKYPASVPVLELFEGRADFGAGTLPRLGQAVWHGAAQGHFGAKNEWLAPNRLRVWPGVMQPGEHQCAADRKRFSPAANRAAVKRMPLGVPFVLSHYYYGKNGFNLDSCCDLTLKDIRVESCRGFGVEIAGTERNTQFVNVRFAPPEGSLRPFSCSADGFHVIRSQGRFKFIGCEWAACQDDFVNLHDRTTIAVPSGERALEVVNTRGARYFGAETGDEVELREDDYGATGWTGRVVGTDGDIISFDRPVPRPKGLCFVLFNRTYATDDYVFRDCVFRDSQHSRTIAMGSNVTFENCRFERLSREPLRLTTSYTPNVWCEGRLTGNVVIRGCTFRDCLGAGVKGANSQIFIGARIPWTGDPVMPQVPIAHEGFRAVWEAWLKKNEPPRLAPESVSGFLVESNAFVNVPGYVVNSPNGRNIVWRGNRVVREGAAVCPPFDYAEQSVGVAEAKPTAFWIDLPRPSPGCNESKSGKWEFAGGIRVQARVCGSYLFKGGILEELSVICAEPKPGATVSLRFRKEAVTKLAGELPADWVVRPEGDTCVVTVPATRGRTAYPDEAVRPLPKDVPELLRTEDGRSVSTREMWERVRRPEILRFFQDRVYGRRPCERPPHLVFTAAEPDRVMMDGAAVRKRVRVTYGGEYGTNSFVFTAFIPTAARRPAASFVLICNRNPRENIDPERVKKSDFWPAEEIVRRGYAAIAFFNGDLAPDFVHGYTQGAFAAFEDVTRKYRNHSAWGVISCWAWGASRVLDWIETESSLDARLVAVVGHSRGGKTALVAAAFDERFALACVNNSGSCGIMLNHLDLPASERPIHTIRGRQNWYCLGFTEFANRELEAPYDAHELAALVAPRLLCVGSAADNSEAGQPGEFWGAYLASPAWELYGRRGLVSPPKFPAVGTVLQEGSVGYHVRPGIHDLTREDWAHYMDFFDKGF